jgi:signal transduction histidine kinase
METIGIQTEWSDEPVVINRDQLLQALLGEIEQMQQTVTDIQRQIDGEDFGAASIQPPCKTPAQYKLEQVFKAMAEGLIILDTDGRIESANPAARILLGLDSSSDLEAVSRTFDHIGCRALMNLEDRSFRPSSGQFRIKSSGDKLLGIRWSALNSDWGQPLGWVLSMQDITTEAAAENIKSEFIAAISHELRTPLTSIQNSVSNILAGVTGKINDKTRDYLDRMKADCHRFADLINDLLDVAKLEAGNLPVMLRIMSVESLVQDTVQEFKAIAEKSSIALECEIEPNICPVYCDAKRIHQVLSNLLRNAVHHTPVGGTIHVSIHDRGSDIVTEVADTGPGIAPDMQKQLFTKFYQIAREAGAGSKGNGLGLAICKGIIAVHGGSVWVESAIGQGSRFFFSLPKTNPLKILRERLTMTTASARRTKNPFGLLLLSFEMTQKSGIPLRQASGKIIAELLAQSQFFMGGDMNLALQIGENEMAFIVNTIGRQTLSAVQYKIEMNLLKFLKKHFTDVPIMPMLGKSLWPEDGNEASQLEKAARSSLAPLIAG